MSLRTARSLTIVIKLGTSSICDETTHLPLLSNLSLVVETIVKLRSLGHKVVLVSSGAIGVGLRRLEMDKKPKKLSAVQAVAAVGQGRLMRMYDDLFSQLNQPIAQILLTRHDLAERTQYLNAVNTFVELLNMKVVPIVNENDTISVSEIKFGDNDTLSAITARMVNADYLFLMTDVDCLYTDNPRINSNAIPIKIVEDIGTLKDSLGTGGMVTKLIAADLATAAGVTTIISKGSNPKNIIKIINNLTQKDSDVESNVAVVEDVPLYTRFLAKEDPIKGHKWWILHGLHTAGKVYIDKGAATAISKKGQKCSLFSAGIVKVQGNFSSNQAVHIVYENRPIKVGEQQQVDDVKDEKENHNVINIGKGLVNYNSMEISRIKGCKSSEIAEKLGYTDSELN
ncbi:16953_t:CDS:2 [Entrophospora sp. SA101]|nr:16953_t:CDS:2 [Entrophospora sp. SA101]